MEMQPLDQALDSSLSDKVTPILSERLQYSQSVKTWRIQDS
jgi:hypothetical protein